MFGVFTMDSGLLYEGLFSWKQQFFQGIAVMLFGVAMIAFPQLLVALISGVTILFGMGMIGTALTARERRRWVRRHWMSRE